MDPLSDLALRLMFPPARAQAPAEPYVPPIGPTSPLQAPEPPPAQPPVRRFVQQRLQAAQQPPLQAPQMVGDDMSPLQPSGAPQGLQQAPPPPAQQPPPTPPGLGYFRQRYGWPEGTREDLIQAQKEERDLMRSAQAGVSGNVAQMMVTGIPIDTAHNFARVGQPTRQFMERAALTQDEPALVQQQAGADSSIMNAAAMQAMMTPGHPAYRALVAGALREDPGLRQYGITEDSPAWMLGQVYAQRKPMVEQAGQAATAAKTGEEARALQMDNDPRNPAIPIAIQTLATYRPDLARQAARTPGITMAQLAKIAGPALEAWKAATDLGMKRLTYQMDVAKWNLEVIGKTGAPPGWRMSRNPQTGMPYRLLGEGEKSQLAEASAAANTVQGILDQMEELVDERGFTGLTGGEKMDRYQSLAGQLKLFAPKLWGQENEKYSKAFDSAVHEILPTGGGYGWLVGESGTKVRSKISEIRRLATEGMAVRFGAMGMEPDTQNVPSSFVPGK